MRLFISCILILAHAQLFAQTAGIAGRVVDSQTLEPLPFANVYINNTTIGTVTDEKGFFKLSPLPAGPNEFIFSFVGYQSYQTKINLVDQQQRELIVRLVVEEKILENVQVQEKRDKVWSNQLKKFNRVFLGTGKSATECKILNPWTLEFTDEKNVLSARASENLVVENAALGYKIYYTLKKFAADNESFTILGNARFEEMKAPDSETNAKWIRNRWSSYRGSQRHLLSSILNHRLRAEGFTLYNDKTGFENSPRSTVFAKELGHSIERFDTSRIQILDDVANHGSNLVLKKRIEVHYEGKSSSIKAYEDVAGSVSWLDLKNGSIKVNEKGVVLNPENIVASGYMSALRISDMLPNDYAPDISRGALNSLQSDQPVNALSLYEKIYIHTDKPYYYPGERIWFNAYVNYYLPSSRDSLSNTTLYAELINPQKEVVMAKIMPIDSGFAANDFILPDSIKPGNYFIRAYTQLQRNFGDENLFISRLPVLQLNDKPVYTSENEKLPGPNEDISVVPDKAFYKKREKVTLTLEMSDTDADPISGVFSMSVTDASQVIIIPGLNTIIDGFPIRKEGLNDSYTIKYPAEYGFSLKGQFFGNHEKKEKALLHLVQFEPFRLAMIDTDNEGYFQYSGLQFYDEQSVSISAVNRKGKPYGRVILMKRDTPPVATKDSNADVEVVNTQSVQRIFSEYDKPADVRMLKEIEVNASRQMTEYEKYNTKHTYGTADYVFDEENIKTQFPNLLFTLQALNISGLIVNPNAETVYFARHQKPQLVTTQSPAEIAAEIARSYTPMVTLDGIPLSGSAGEALSAIDPNTVASIEVTKKPSAIRGTQGPYGVIAVFTKKSVSKNKEIQSELPVLKVQGYSGRSRFSHPDYGDPGVEKTLTDYRSTLYWNPAIKVGTHSTTSQVSFYTSDLAGKYRIIIEGVNSNGKPIRNISFVDVRE